LVFNNQNQLQKAQNSEEKKNLFTVVIDLHASGAGG
jgi:hypothetical protein